MFINISKFSSNVNMKDPFHFKTINWGKGLSLIHFLKSDQITKFAFKPLPGQADNFLALLIEV